MQTFQRMQRMALSVSGLLIGSIVLACGDTSSAPQPISGDGPIGVVAARTAIMTQPSSSTTSGAVLARQPVIQLRDASDNAVAKSGVTVTAAIASGGGTLAGTTTVATDANGVATFTDLSIAGSVGNRTLSFTAPALTGATSNAISVATTPIETTPPPPQGNGEPLFNASTNTVIYQDNMDGYSDPRVMGAGPQGTQPRFTPHPAPVTNSEPVKSGMQLTAGRGGSGKALRMAYSGRNNEEHSFITLNMPRTPDMTTHYFSYYARIGVNGPWMGAIPIKWFQAWHNSGNSRIQWATHDPAPCDVGNFAKTYWQVWDQRETKCQGNQPIGPFFNDLANDGKWHRFTYMFKPNSAPGARDGIARMWVDGVKVIDVSKATIGVTPPGGEKPWCLADDVDALAVNNGVRDLWVGGAQTLPSSPWTYDVDDLVWWR